MKRIIPLLCLIACLLLLSGCGRSLVINTGFRRGEVFRIGSTGCRIGEVRVYMLDLQKQSEILYGGAIWDGDDSGELQEAVKQQALSQITRVKILNRMGVSRNVMLTREEELLSEDAEHQYYAGLSEAEQKYLGVDEKNLQRMFRECALAEKTWRSLGEDAEQAYQDYCEQTQCDLNTVYWQKVVLKRLEGDLEAPGFAQCYREVYAGIRAAETDEDGAQGSTAEAAADENAEAPADAAADENAEAPAEAAADEKAEAPAEAPADEKAEAPAEAGAAGDAEAPAKPAE